MLSLKNYSEDIEKVLKSQKKVKDDGQIKKTVDYILSQLDIINTLDSEAVRVGNHDLSEIMIPNVFKDMILPSKVKIDTLDYLKKDVLDVMPIDSDGKVMDRPKTIEFDMLEWNINLATLFGFVKKDVSECTKLSDLRKPLDFIGGLSKYSYGDKVFYTGTPFIPVPVTVPFNIFNIETAPTSLKDNVIKDYISMMRF